jgi:uncharacterized peroxidase-related enzyme
MADQPIPPGVRVPVIAESEATGRTAELYQQIREALGIPFVPDMFRLTSTRPELLTAVIAGYEGVFHHGVLPRETKELIASWTSRVNSCPYCVGTHNYFLLLFGGSEELTQAIQEASSPEELPVDARTKAILRLVTKVSQAAYKVTDDDWAQAEAAGWTSADMLEAVFTAALFNFITRLVDSVGLGTSVTASRVSQLTGD